MKKDFLWVPPSWWPREWQNLTINASHPYYSSPEWRAKRAQVHQRSGLRCENTSCGRRCERAAQVVHHVEPTGYANFGREHVCELSDSRNDLLDLCRPCHDYMHTPEMDNPALITIVRILGGAMVRAPVAANDNDSHAPRWFRRRRWRERREKDWYVRGSRRLNRKGVK